jgi:uncharacterized protein (DUF3084 family)
VRLPSQYQLGSSVTHNVLLAFNIDKSDEWQQAETLITNYKNMLEQREGLQTEVKTLEQEKNKLEEELQARLNDKVNDELAFPPSSMIQMDCEEKKDAP